MANPNIAAEQLLELLLTLKVGASLSLISPNISFSRRSAEHCAILTLQLYFQKTTPEAARTILNNQPAIAYALMTLMVSMNAVNIEVFQVGSSHNLPELRLIQLISFL
jgi:hypothetical protein